MENILVLKQTFIQQIIAFKNFSRKLFLKNNYQVESVWYYYYYYYYFKIALKEKVFENNS